MGTIMCFCNRLLVTKFVNIPFKIGSLLGCLLCVEHSSENAQVQGLDRKWMKKQPMPIEKVGWLLLLKFESAIISDLQLFQVQQLSLSSEKDHLIQMCQTYSKARSAKLSSPEHWIQKLNVSEKHFFSLFFFANGSCHTSSISSSIVTFTILLLTTVRHCSLTSHSTQR